MMICWNETRSLKVIPSLTLQIYVYYLKQQRKSIKFFKIAQKYGTVKVKTD